MQCCPGECSVEGKKAAKVLLSPASGPCPSARDELCSDAGCWTSFQLPYAVIFPVVMCVESSVESSVANSFFCMLLFLLFLIYLLTTVIYYLLISFSLLPTQCMLFLLYCSLLLLHLLFPQTEIKAPLAGWLSILPSFLPPSLPSFHPLIHLSTHYFLPSSFLLSLIHSFTHLSIYPLSSCGTPPFQKEQAYFLETPPEKQLPKQRITILSYLLWPGTSDFLHLVTFLAATT